MLFDVGAKVSVRYDRRVDPGQHLFYPSRFQGEVIGVYPKFAVIRTQKGYTTTLPWADLRTGRCKVLLVNPVVVCA